MQTLRDRPHRHSHVKLVYNFVTDEPLTQFKTIGQYKNIETLF